MTEVNDRWYYDLDEVSHDDEDLDDVFEWSPRITTREDVEKGRSNATFDIIPEETVHGLENFTQNTVVLFVDETSLTPDEVLNNMGKIEQELEKAALERVPKVGHVAASPSDRHEDEIHISMSVEKEGRKYSTNFYLGPEKSIPDPK